MRTVRFEMVATFISMMLSVMACSGSDATSVVDPFTGTVRAVRAAKAPEVTQGLFTATCSGLTCAFAENSSAYTGRVKTKSYDFGDGSTAAAGNATHSYKTVGTFTVRFSARYASGAELTQAQVVNVAPPAATFRKLILSPASIATPTGTTSQFSVVGEWSDGSTSAVAATYSASGGTIAPDGKYTSGAVPGTFRVIATRAGGIEADTSVVTITATTLRAAASARGFQIGAAVRDSAFRNDAQYRQTLVSQFNSIVPEDATDFWPIHPGATQYNFAAADALVSFAQANGMKFHGHTLVWHSWIPTWVTNGGYSNAQVRAILKDHITTVVTRYRGKAASWDVVNEVIDNEQCCSLQKSFWMDRLGPEYIDSAFVWARRADPGAKLYLNDYATENINPKSTALLALAQALRARGVPVDGVGFQVHILPMLPPPTTVQANFERFARAGFGIRITEMDVAIPDNGGAAALANQGATFANILNACLNVPSCTELTMWGFSDRFNWVPYSFPGLGRALPFDATYRPKPALDSLNARLRR